MIVPDVTVLVHAHRADAAAHELCHAWLEAAMGGAGDIGLADAVIAGFVRIVTSPRIFRVPMSVDQALDAIDALLQHPRVTRVVAGARHWQTLAQLCRDAGARGDLISNAVIAAVAIEYDATVVSFDQDFARFRGLRWHPPTAQRADVTEFTRAWAS